MTGYGMTGRAPIQPEPPPGPATQNRAICTWQLARDSAYASRALTDTYHLTSITLMKFGDALNAWHAADRALGVADGLEDPVAIALATQALTWAATGIGQAPAGIAVVQSALDRTGAELASRGEDGWTARGMMQLKAVVAAAAIGNARPAT